MHRSAQWYADQERELQRLVWPNGAPAPRRSAAESLYPNHGSAARQFEIVRREPGAAPNTAAALYPNLKGR
jgi:hypothetical protein